VSETLWKHVNKKIEKKTKKKKIQEKKEKDQTGPTHLDRPKHPAGHLHPRARSPIGRLRHCIQLSFLSFPNL
jgi:hypothetical protein